jgi:hypothetical protein
MWSPRLRFGSRSLREGCSTQHHDGGEWDCLRYSSLVANLLAKAQLVLRSWSWYRMRAVMLLGMRGVMVDGRAPGWYAAEWDIPRACGLVEAMFTSHTKASGPGTGPRLDDWSIEAQLPDHIGWHATALQRALRRRPAWVLHLLHLRCRAKTQRSQESSVDQSTKVPYGTGSLAIQSFWLLRQMRNCPATVTAIRTIHHTLEYSPRPRSQ